MQKLTENTKQTAKLIVSTGTQKLTLKAHGETLKAIANSEDSDKEVSAHDLLFAPQFNLMYNRFYTITKISHQ